MDYLGYFRARLMHFWYRLTKKVEPGEELKEELYYISEYEGNWNKGKPLKVIRHVYITSDPQMGRRPCFEVRLPSGRKKFYLDPRVGSYEDRKGNRPRLVTKTEAKAGL